MKGLDRYTELVWKPFFEDTFQFIRDKTILDAGCGEARYTKQLADSNDYHGIDLRCTQYATEIGMVEDMPYPDKMFDEVIAIGILDYADPVKSLEEFNRVLKSGGILRLMVPNKENPYHAVSSNLGKGDKRRYAKDEIMDLVERSGFSVDCCLVMGFSFYVPGKWLQELLIPLWMSVEHRLGSKYGMNIYIEAYKN